MLLLKCDRQLAAALEDRILEQDSRVEELEARLTEMQTEIS